MTDPQIQTPAAPAPLLPLPEPHAGGNYLRDPVTGALTLNPAHLDSADTDTEFPQE